MRLIENFSEIYPEENATDVDKMRRIKFTAGFTNPINDFNASELPYLQELLQENRFDVQLTMKKLMYPCTKLMNRCRWEGVIVDCKELFLVSETYQGYCCSFNMLKPTGSLIAQKNQKARKTQYFGPDMGLSVIINPLIEVNAMTSVNSEGIKILVNQPILYPSQRTLERMLPHRQMSFVEIRPERTYCSTTVRSLPISDRGCVFDNEYQLKWVFDDIYDDKLIKQTHFFRFFKDAYMEENCIVECNMELHMKTCECLPYYFYNTDNVETCSFKSIKCMIENRGKKLRLWFLKWFVYIYSQIFCAIWRTTTFPIHVHAPHNATVKLTNFA